MNRIEHLLFEAAGALVVEPPLVRRVIKAHRRISGMAPHARCYPMARDELMETGLVNELPVRFDQLPASVVLLSRLGRASDGGGEAGLLSRYWRSVVHARVHLELDASLGHDGIDAAELRKRIDRIGQVEFDEVRALLRHDDLALPPFGDREVYVEFAALYLELRHFAPGLLVTTFPGIARFDDLDAMFAADLDVARLIDQGRPSEVDRPHATRPPVPGFGSASTQVTLGATEDVPMPRASPRRARALVDRSARERARGRDVAAAIAALQASQVEDDALRRRAEGLAKESLASLATRLATALRVPGREETRRSEPSWGPLLRIVSERAAVERSSRFSVESRLLAALQSAALAHEHPASSVDGLAWLRSFGRAPVVRSLPATREIRIARSIAEAAKLVRHTRVPSAERKLLGKLVDFGLARAEENVRTVLRPRLHEAFDRVGLVAGTEPERLARDKVVEELLDSTLENGFLSFGGLRDALSRNQLKLPDLVGLPELWTGDPLLRLDRVLADDLAGLYRPSEFYLRAFHKLSSLPFGTDVGRFTTLFVVVPFLAAVVLLAAVEQVLGIVHLRAAVFSPPWVALLTVVIFALLHSAAFRHAASQGLELVGLVLGFVFLRIPRAVLARPAVRRWFSLPHVRFVARRVVIPAAITAAGWRLGARWIPEGWRGVAIGAGSFLVVSGVFGTRIGAALEDLFFDQLAPGWHRVSRQWVPGLFRAIGRFFDAAVDRLERALYRVDEGLRFREGQGAVALGFKGAVGVVWAAFAYVVRLYVTLMIEPFVNPLKHFPVVVVADKLMLAYLPTILAFSTKLFSPFGTIFGGFLAWMTTFLAPSIFGFLAWELKENYRLYRATRPEALLPAHLGPHGETMRGLLVVGIHSGTLPKLYERLRRAAQREDDSAVVRGRTVRGGAPASLGAFREGLHGVEQGLRRFVARELVAVLAGLARWPFGEIQIDSVDLSSNRIRVRLRCPALSSEVCELRFEEQSGMVVAGLAEPGFVRELVARAPEAAALFENALAGLYQRAEVDLVREQLEDELGTSVAYDVADQSIVVWPGGGYRTELVYPLIRGGAAVAPRVVGDPPPGPVRVLDRRNIAFREQGIGWLAWVSAWSAAAHADAPVPRLVRGPSLLPRAGRAETKPA